MIRLQINYDTLPGLYQSADKASLDAQSQYFWGLRLYLVLLVLAGAVSFAMDEGRFGAIASALLFLITLLILVALRVARPDETWYNGRAVAESVKTRAWRWSMRAEPYEQKPNQDEVIEQFIDDLKDILDQNAGLSTKLLPDASRNHPISDTMTTVRNLPLMERLQIYKTQRVDDQAAWYSSKSRFSRRKGQWWFGVSVVLHTLAIALLLSRIANPEVAVPTDAIATAAGAALTWLQAKKYNELESSYALAANEIDYARAKAALVKTEQQFSEFVLSSEAAFSREHTQWVARRAE